MNKVALLVALGIAALGAFLLVIYLRRFEQEASGGAKIKLLVAVKPIRSGQLLTEDMLATREVPSAYVEDRAVRDTERPKVIGLRVSTPVQAQQTLQWTDLAIATDDRRELSELVQPGMRAVSVRATTENSFALIRPGDRVDVIATMIMEKDQRQAIVLMQNVLVLAVGLDMGSDPGTKRAHGDRGDQMITLSITVPQAQLISLATEKGHLSVALRNPDDVRLSEGLTDMNSSVITNTVQRQGVQGSQRGPIRIGTENQP